MRNIEKLYCLLRLKQVSHCGYLFIYLLDKYEELQKPIEYTNFQLAQFFEVEERTIERQLKSLVKSGLLKREGGKTKNRLLIPYVEPEWLEDSSIYECLRSLEAKPALMGKAIVTIPEDVLEIFEYWNKLEVFPKVDYEHQEGNFFLVPPKVAKLVSVVQTVLAGTFYNFSKEYRFHHDKKWHVQQVKWAIENFYQAATDPDCYPIDKKTYLKRTLDQFFYSRFLRLQAPFIRYQEKPTVLNIPREDNKHQGFYLTLKDSFEKEILHGRQLSTIQDARMVIISNIYGDYIQEWKKQGLSHSSITGGTWAGRLVDFVRDNTWVNDPIRFLSDRKNWDKVIFYFNKIRALTPG